MSSSFLSLRQLGAVELPPPPQILVTVVSVLNCLADGKYLVFSWYSIFINKERAALLQPFRHITTKVDSDNSRDMIAAE